MDLTDAQAIVHLEKTVIQLIERYRLDLFRLDYNTSPFDGGQMPRDGYQESTLWRYYENVYRLYDRLASRYPNVIMENCAGGGGRTDPGCCATSTTPGSPTGRLRRARRASSTA